MFLGREALEDHSQLPKKAALGRLQAFRMYGGIGMSASSLHRESTDWKNTTHYNIVQVRKEAFLYTHTLVLLRIWIAP